MIGPPQVSSFRVVPIAINHNPFTCKFELYVCVSRAVRIEPDEQHFLSLLYLAVAFSRTGTTTMLFHIVHHNPF
jgi:hypothetical protein